MQATAELEHLLEKPYLIAREPKGLVNLFSRLFDHPLTGSADNDSRRGFLSFYREGGHIVIRPGTGRRVRLTAVDTYSQPIAFRRDQRGIRGST